MRASPSDIKRTLERLELVFGVPSWYKNPAGTYEIWWEKLQQYDQEAIGFATEASLMDEPRFPNLPAFLRRVRAAERDLRANQPPPATSDPADEEACVVCGARPEWVTIPGKGERYKLEHDRQAHGLPPKTAIHG